MTGKPADAIAMSQRAERTLALTICAIAAARGLDEHAVLGHGPLTTATDAFDQTELAHERRAIIDRMSIEDLRAMPLATLGASVEVLHTNTPARGSKRSALGAFYTPAWLVDHVLDLTLEPLITEALSTNPARARTSILSLRIADPACGSGRFLTAVADRLAAHLKRLDPSLTIDDARALVITHCIAGVDRDAIGAQVCRCVLWLHARGQVDRAALDRTIVCGDALACAPPPTSTHTNPSSSLFNWHSTFPTAFNRSRSGFDAIVGNPPFLNQLRTSTARDKRLMDAVRDWSQSTVTRYADTASVFLLLSTVLVREGGRIGLVQPISTLVTGDAQPIRSAVAQRCDLSAIWWSTKPVFDADVRTCAIVLTRRSSGPDTSRAVARTIGQPPAPTSPITYEPAALIAQPTWAPLIAPADLPAVTPHSTHTLADFATATADFRDQYYGLRNCIVDDADLTPPQRKPPYAWPPIITSGLIDLGRHAWGQRSTRLLNQSWRAPRADSHALRRDRALAQWLDARLIPKVLLATQSRVLECVVDEQGELLPSVPVITLAPKPIQPTGHRGRPLWRIAAAVCSPVCCAVALRHFAGAALSLGAIKLSANQTLTLPMPSNLEAWESGAFALRTLSSLEFEHPARRKALEHFASIMADAYAIPDAQREALSNWWLARRP